MTTYVMLANWTDQGALKVKDSPRRLDLAKMLWRHVSACSLACWETSGRAR
jgi:uncharacterized protein with GYD domain